MKKDDGMNYAPTENNMLMLSLIKAINSIDERLEGISNSFEDLNERFEVLNDTLRYTNRIMLKDNPDFI